MIFCIQSLQGMNTSILNDYDTINYEKSNLMQSVIVDLFETKNKDRLESNASYNTNISAKEYSTAQLNNNESDCEEIESDHKKKDSDYDSGSDSDYIDNLIKKKRKKNKITANFFCQFCHKNFAQKGGRFNHEHYFCKKRIDEGFIKIIFCKFRNKGCRYKCTRIYELKKHTKFLCKFKYR